MIAKLIIPDKTGHTEVTWDTEVGADEVGLGTHTRKAAEDLFNELTGQGSLAFATLAEVDTRTLQPVREQVREFDPAAQEIVFTRPMQGG